MGQGLTFIEWARRAVIVALLLAIVMIAQKVSIDIYRYGLLLLVGATLLQIAVGNVPDGSSAVRAILVILLILGIIAALILSTLGELSLRKDTIVVFTSDNGGSNAENNDLKYPDDNCPEGRLPGNNRPLRGRKGDVYEGGIRVPTIVSWPGRLTARKIDTPVQITDWMPTFCQLAGFEGPPSVNWDGRDLSALILGGDGSSRPTDLCRGPAISCEGSAPGRSEARPAWERCSGADGTVRPGR